MTRRAALARLSRTLRHLEPGQVLSRAAEPVVDAIDRRGPAQDGPVEPRGWPDAFTPGDVRLAPAHVGPDGHDITLLGTSRTMGRPSDWDWTAPDAPRLWRFHLNYWDWAHELARRPDGPQILEDLVTGWVSRTRYGIGDEWEPYVVSLRLWSLCALHRPGSAPVGGEPLVRSVAQQQHHLSRRLEWDIRGNHLLKNLKALCGAAAFLGQDDRLRGELDRAHAQIARQILSDGGHEERSPSYHVQVMQDVVDLRDLARATGHASAAADLGRVATAMSEWLHAMTFHGDLPALNDGFPVPASQLDLLDAGGDEGHLADLALLAESGYVRARAGRWDHLLDVGPLGPTHNPGHGHADTLGFLSWFDGLPVLVDTGTSTYATGPTRSHERSTRAHNAVEVDGVDSSEVWGSFRVGRRANAVLNSARAAAGHVHVDATHDGYRQTHGVDVRRSWTVLPDRLVVTDELLPGPGTPAPPVTSHLHLHPDYRWSGEQAVGPAGTVTVTCHDDRGRPLAVDVGASRIAEGLDRTTEAVHLELRWPPGSTHVTTTVRVASANDTQRESS